MSREKRHTSHDNGWLYVLGYRETSEFCKIGITTRNVSDRIREMQTGSPYTIYAYAIFNASWIEDLGALEQKCHKLFRGFRMQGEWFNVEPSVAEQRIREEYGAKGRREELPLFIEWRDDKRVEDPNRAVFLKNEIVLDKKEDQTVVSDKKHEGIEGMIEGRLVIFLVIVVISIALAKDASFATLILITLLAGFFAWLLKKIFPSK